MVDENLHDKIEQYLLGQLPQEEAAKLEDEIAANPALAEQVTLQRLGFMGIQRLAATKMRAKFDEWDADMDSPSASSSARNTAPSPGRNPWVWITFALLLLSAAGAFGYYRQIKKERGKREQERRQIAFRDSMIAVLQAGYREKAAQLEALTVKPGGDSLTLLEIKRLREELDRKEKALRKLEQRRPAANRQIAMQLAPPPTQFGSRGDEDDPVLDAAKQAYEKHDYNEAVRLLKNISPSDPRQAQVAQRLPYALYYAGRFEEAIPAFLKLWEMDEDNEAMNAQGFLLLCYIAEGKMLEARQMRLVIMQNRGHKFYKTAEEAGKNIQ